MAITEELLTERQLAERLQLTPRTLQEYRRRGGGPPYLKWSHNVVRYAWPDVLEWAEEHRQTSTAQD